MFRIFVCDEDTNFQKEIGDLIGRSLSEKVKQFEIQYFSSGKELLNSNYGQCDLFCLSDFWDRDMNGLELARQVRLININASILFLATHSELACAAFEVDAFRYLLKPDYKEQLKNALQLILKKRREQLSKLLTFQQGHKYIRIPYDEILYFETVERKVRAVTVSKDYTFDNKINDLTQQLGEHNFFRIHISYLINLAFVKEYELTNVTMLNGDVLFMSRLRSKEFREAYRRYLGVEEIIL